jgi:hypothetical protein
MDPAMILAIVFFAVAAWFGWQWRLTQRRLDAARHLGVALAGHAAEGTPFELLQQAGGRAGELASGGDNSPGTFDNRDSCPCRHSYTCATKTIQLNAWPNPKPNPVAGFPWNAPPRKMETWACPGNCVIVPTRIWRGWRVVQLANGTILMHIHTFTQYHCKEPTDPDINKVPEGGILPPKPEEMPKPGDIT